MHASKHRVSRTPLLGGGHRADLTGFAQQPRRRARAAIFSGVGERSPVRYERESLGRQAQALRLTRDGPGGAAQLTERLLDDSRSQAEADRRRARASDVREAARSPIRPTLEGDRGAAVPPRKHKLVEAALADDEIPLTATVDLAPLARQRQQR
jgi:hypothetical protein